MLWNHQLSSLLSPTDRGWKLLAVGVTALVGHLKIVERRGRKEELSPTRQIEIDTLLESMPDAILIVDANHRIMDVNTAAALLAGKPREELRGVMLEEISKNSRHPATKVINFERPLVERVLSGQTIREERRVLQNAASGAETELLVFGNPIRNAKNEIVGALLMARDVTELTQLQNRIADIERHHAIGQVAASIAHDVNNTFQTIAQSAAILKRMPNRPYEEQKVFLDLIENAVQRGAEIISRIRDYVRSGSSEVQLVDIARLLDDAIQLTRPMWQVKSGLRMRRDLNPVKPVRANPADLRRVFTNLILNAVQAMPDGGDVTIGCDCNEQRVHVWVRDTGLGISPEDQKKIFNPYFTTKPRGTGLGLSGAQKILLSLGGNIRFQSRPGEGTQFDIYLPSAEAEVNRNTA